MGSLSTELSLFLRAEDLAWATVPAYSALVYNKVKLPCHPGSTFQIPCQVVSAHFSHANTTGLKAALETPLGNNPN